MPSTPWPLPLVDNGESLQQLISHEYILRLIDTPEGVPGETPFDMRAPLDYIHERDKLTTDDITKQFKRAFAGVIEACEGYKICKEFKIPGMVFNSGIDHVLGPKDRDVTHAQRLLKFSLDEAMNTEEVDKTQFHVGIVGAGMAGLYTAMILKTLAIPYEILEASNRIGGRVYTHRFSNDPGDYYDAGAMRFPDIPIMDRTFRLFRQLGIEKKPYKTENEFRANGPPRREHVHSREYRREQSHRHGDLIPYHFTGENTPSYFNDRLLTIKPSLPCAEKDPYSFSTANGGTVHNSIIARGELEVFNIFTTLRKEFKDNPYPTLKALYDKDKRAVTVRQELIEKMTLKVMYSIGKYDPENNPELFPRSLTLAEKYHVSNWCETKLGSTCSFDEALIESFIHSIYFNYPVPVGPAGDPPAGSQEKNVWWCLNGGADIIAQEMMKNVGENTITKNARVTAIRKHQDPSHRPMRVLLEGNPTERRFSHVITTTTTPCLQVMDLTGVRMQTDQREALRLLRYQSAVKLGVKFSEKWWIAGGINRGGVGKTDRPTRIVVYPSYSLDDGKTSEGVLLACYNSSTDAARLGALFRGSDPTNQQLILNVVLHDLAMMHDIPYKTLRDLVVAHHFHDWGRDEFTVGAWGDFGPGQFSNYFTSLQVPAAGGKLFFAGELTSIYHGWIVAALNSAHRAVYLMLLKEDRYDLLQKMTDIWGHLTEHDIPSALCFVALAERGENFAELRETIAGMAELKERDPREWLRLDEIQKEKRKEKKRQEKEDQDKKRQAEGGVQ